MKLLITGGAGFIGSNLIERILAEKKDKVICIDNFDSFYDPKIKKENITPFLNNKKISFYKADIRNYAVMRKIFSSERPDYVIHLAAKANTRESLENVKEYEEVNIGGTINLLELSKINKIKQFVFISSSSVYGNSAKAPFKESDIAGMPISPYGATKRAGEIIAYSYFYNFQLPITCLRLFNAFGERNRPDLVIYKWVKNILNGETIEMSGTGNRLRDFTYVGDIVDAILLSLKRGEGYEILNIGNSKPISLTELLKKVEETLGKKAVVKSRESHHVSSEKTCADINKAKKVIGWEPKVKFEDGLDRFVAWFRQNRSKDII